MDYSIITKCYDLVRKYEKSYYTNYITLDPTEKFPLPSDFNKEYEEYKKTLWKYEDYLKQFKDTDTTASKDTCDTAITWADNTNCWPVSKEEFLKTMWKTMPYSEFEKMKQNEINSQRENMMKEQKRYKEILESME